MPRGRADTLGGRRVLPGAALAAWGPVFVAKGLPAPRLRAPQVGGGSGASQAAFLPSIGPELPHPLSAADFGLEVTCCTGARCQGPCVALSRPPPLSYLGSQGRKVCQRGGVGGERTQRKAAFPNPLWLPVWPGHRVLCLQVVSEGDRLGVFLPDIPLPTWSSRGPLPDALGGCPAHAGYGPDMPLPGRPDTHTCVIYSVLIDSVINSFVLLIILNSNYNAS